VSPVRYCGDEFDYNIENPEEIRLAYSLGSALYAVRRDLTSLHAWSSQPGHVGSQFVYVFGKFNSALFRARSNHTAAKKLRRGLISELGSLDFQDQAEGALRDSLVAALRAEESSPVDDPFWVIFNYVTEYASLLYGDSWPDKVQCLCQAIGDQPFPGTKFWVNANTVLDLDNPAAPPSVRLNINPYRLNAETYSAIFAIFVHECFCHVPAYRAKQSNKSPFSEGFCDWAARELFERWLYEMDPSLADAARQFGQQIWTLMMSQEGGNKFWQQRQAGHAAANHLVRMFMVDGATDQEAISLVIELARQLVVTEAELLLKDSFVRDLIPLPIDPDLCERLRKWRSGLADARSLLLSGAS
jgi:hypothetical protein